MSLYPIVPGSRTERDIHRMEEALRTLRDLTVAAGVAQAFNASDSSRGFGNVAFSKLFFSDEDVYDFQRFYHYYGIDFRDNPETTAQGCKQAGPQWVKFGTEDRLVWGNLLPQLLRALAGKGVHVARSQSWRWDRTEHPRANGKPRYVPVYEMMVTLDVAGARAWNPEPVIEAALRSHCMGLHPLADQHLFDWQEDTVQERLFSHYGWTRSGVVVFFDRLKALKRAKEILFPGLPCMEAKVGKGRSQSWSLTIDLSQPEGQQTRNESAHA